MSAAETYRGVPVPRECLAYDGKPTQQFRLGVDAALAVTVPLVESLHYDSTCSFDHHGYCQEHAHLADGPCPDGEAQKFIAAMKEGGPSDE